MVQSLVVLSTLAALTSAASAEDDVGGSRSPTAAVVISLGATVGSLALAGTGLALNASHHSAELDASLLAMGATSLVITPSMGHLYGAHSVATPWTLIRGAGLVTVLVGTTVLWGDAFGNWGCSPEGTCSPPRSDRGLYIIGAGTIVMLVGAVADIATAGSATTRWTNEHHLALAPTMLKMPSGTTAAGIGVSGRF